MKAYDNLGGNSGVVAYDYDSEVIKVQFDDGWIYVDGLSEDGKTCSFQAIVKA